VFGYWSYLGVDGAVYVGIECAPFVSRASEVEVEVQRSGLFARRFEWLGRLDGKYTAIRHEGEDAGIPLKRPK
jgi:hypothetical protein